MTANNLTGWPGDKRRVSHFYQGRRKKLMPHYIDEESKRQLLMLCGLPEHGDVPWEVEEAYWKFKRYYDRCYSMQRIDRSALVYMAMKYTPGEPKKEEYEPKTTALTHPPKYDDRVKVKWRGKKVFAAFKSISADKKFVQVLIENDKSAEERLIKIDNVEVIEQPELAGK